VFVREFGCASSEAMGKDEASFKRQGSRFLWSLQLPSPSVLLFRQQIQTTSGPQHQPFDCGVFRKSSV